MTDSPSSVNISNQAEVKSTLRALAGAKKIAAENGDEKLANQLWCEIQALKTVSGYLAAINDIKQKKYRNAWCELEQCEITCKFLGKNSSEEFYKNSGADFVERYVSKWQSLYPYCMFMSPGVVVGYHTCSICDHKIRPRSRCKHVKGRVYNGELCTHQMNDLEFREISIVTKPVQKFSVLHNDETLDFSLLDYLCSHINSPFDEWEIHWTKKGLQEIVSARSPKNTSVLVRVGLASENAVQKSLKLKLPTLILSLKTALTRTLKLKGFRTSA